jgi:alpha-beta hydrolase superfamily lysophospholipase
MFVASLAISLPIITSTALAQVTRQDNGELSQSLKLPIYEWQDSEVPAKAMIVAIHGCTLHAGTFDFLARHLAAEGFLFYAPDLRGYGRWQKGDFDSKKDCSIDYGQSETDLLAVLATLKKRHPDLKLYCLGESIGSNLAILLAAKQPDLVDGLILASPCVKRIQHLGPRALLDISWGVVRPHREISLNTYITSYLSNDPRVTSAYINDPLCRKGVSFHDLLSTVAYNQLGVRNANELKPDLPVLFIAGKKDEIYKASAVPKFAQRIASAKKTIIIIPDQGHILVETPYMTATVIGDIDHWLATITGSEKTLSFK